MSAEALKAARLAYEPFSHVPDFRGVAAACEAYHEVLITTLRAERDAAVALNNKYAWERDKAREERDTAEALVQSMREALEWYSERAGLVGAWSVEGAKARAELTADNGAKADAALSRSEV